MVKIIFLLMAFSLSFTHEIDTTEAIPRESDSLQFNSHKELKRYYHNELKKLKKFYQSELKKMGGSVKDSIILYRVEREFVRDSLRRMDNILMGLSVNNTGYLAPHTSKALGDVINPHMGVEIGYKTHISEELGFQFGSRFTLGYSYVYLNHQGDSLSSNNNLRDGARFDGQSMGLEILANLIMGPLRVITLEPGIGFSKRFFTSNKVNLQTDSETQTYLLPESPMYGFGSMGISVYPTYEQTTKVGLQVMLGVDFENRDSYMWQVGANIGHYFQLP